MTDEPTEAEIVRPPTLSNYRVKIAGGFILPIRAKSEDHAEGLAIGELRAKLPRFIINSVIVEEA